jgi:hypothetical protein
MAFARQLKFIMEWFSANAETLIFIVVFGAGLLVLRQEAERGE